MKKNAILKMIYQAKKIYAYINLNGAGGYVQVMKKDIVEWVRNSEDDEALSEAYSGLSLNELGNLYLN